MNKKLPVSIVFLLSVTSIVYAQNIRFSFIVENTGSNTSDVKIYAQTTSGTENMAGYTVYFYYDNTETTVTGYSSSPTTSDLGWGTNNETNIHYQLENNGIVGITHTGYFFYQNIDNGLTGDDFSITPVHLLTIQFDHTIGTPASGSGWIAGTTEVGPLEYVNSALVGFDVIVVGAQAQALPVELLSFRAFPLEKMTQLEWTTASEINSDRFEVQHSVDGRFFLKIGEVQAAGNSTDERQYGFLHENPVSGINYYRLKMKDLDGSFEYPQILAITFTDVSILSNLMIYPNPASDRMYLKMPEMEAFQVELFDHSGKLVLRTENTSNIKVGSLANGAYQVKLTDLQSGKKNLVPVIVNR